MRDIIRRGRLRARHRFRFEIADAISASILARGLSFAFVKSRTHGALFASNTRPRCSALPFRSLSGSIKSSA